MILRRTAFYINLPINLKFLFFCIGIVSFATASQGQAKPKLAGQLDNYRQSQIYLRRFAGLAAYVYDSATVDQKGNFSFELPKEMPRGFYMLDLGDKRQVTLILGAEEVALSADAQNFDQTVTITGSAENSLLLEFKRQSAIYQNKMQALATVKQKLSQTNSAESAKKLTELKKEQDSVSYVFQDFLNKIHQNNPDKLMGLVAGLLKSPEGTGKFSYFDSKLMANDDLGNGDVMHLKINMYFQEHQPASLPELAKMINYVINQTQPGSKVREVSYQSLIQLLNNAQTASIAHQLADNYIKEYDSERARSLKATLPQPPPGPGVDAPEITGTTPDGQTIKLSDLKGKVVLLDFWASWCGPCRRENPNVVKAYDRFKADGFTVFSVSLDKSQDKWVSAISKDGLKWPNHVSDLQGWQSEAAAQYKVRSIPSTFLIDKDGKIIAQNLRGQALENKLEELFKGK